MKMHRIPNEKGIFKVAGDKENPYFVSVSLRDQNTRKRIYAQDRAPNLTLARAKRHELRLRLINRIESSPQVRLKDFVQKDYLNHLTEHSRPSTVIRTTSCINANIILPLGDRFLDEIRAVDIEQLLTGAFKDRSAQTKRHICLFSEDRHPFRKRFGTLECV